MREGIGRNKRKCCDILGGLLGRMGEDIGRNERKCCDILGSLRRQIGRIPMSNRDEYIIKI